MIAYAGMLAPFLSLSLHESGIIVPPNHKPMDG